MRARLILIVIGVLLAAGGLYITAANPVLVGNGSNQCTIDNGCRAGQTVSIPSFGLGMLVFVSGLIVGVYGYRRDDSEE